MEKLAKQLWGDNIKTVDWSTVKSARGENADDSGNSDGENAGDNAGNNTVTPAPASPTPASGSET